MAGALKESRQRTGTEEGLYLTCACHGKARTRADSSDVCRIDELARDHTGTDSPSHITVSSKPYESVPNLRSEVH
jgi:hypothetical protein